MLLALPFTLLLGSYVAAAPSIHHAQIRVDITDINVQNHVDALHSSEELVMNQVGLGEKSLPFNFTLSARPVKGSASLPFGFATLDATDGLIRGELGFSTEFAFRNGRLITGDRALSYHLAEIFPPWTSLWSLNKEVPGPFIELIAISQASEGKLTHFLVFERNGKFTSGASMLTS